MIERLWKAVFNKSETPELENGSHRSLDVVLSVPPDLAGDLERRAGPWLPTLEAFRALLSNARESVKIFSPYVDPSFTNMIYETPAPVRIVTTLRDAKMKSNPVLERCSTARRLSVRYLHEKRARSQIYQLHAKMILCDRTAAYVGSANFTDTSLHYNLELGLWMEDPDVIDRLHKYFDYLFESVAQPAQS